MVRDKSRTEIRPPKMRGEKELWFLLFPLKHNLLSKEIFKSQKLVRREPELGAGEPAQDTSGIPGI